MPFDEFLENFQEKLGAQRAQNRDSDSLRTHLEQYFEFKGRFDVPSRVKDALDYVFGSEKNKLDSYEPDQKQTRDFIDYLIFAIRAENKERSQDRCLALTKVLDYNENPGTPIFPVSNRLYLRFSLRSASENPP